MAQESQFWPSKHLTIYKYYEYGLGSITQMGADTLLRWNADFSKKFCKQVYNDETCKTAYAFLPASQQAALRGSVLQSLDAVITERHAGATAGDTTLLGVVLLAVLDLAGNQHDRASSFLLGALGDRRNFDRDRLSDILRRLGASLAQTARVSRRRKHPSLFQLLENPELLDYIIS